MNILKFLFDSLPPDEPIGGQDEIVIHHWRLRPRNKKYLIARFYDTGYAKLGLITTEGVVIEAYDNGFDSYGKLNPGTWKPLHHHCMWSKEGLKVLKAELEGQPLKPEIVKE